MPTADESNHSAAGTLYQHHTDRHTSLSKAVGRTVYIAIMQCLYRTYGTVCYCTTVQLLLNVTVIYLRPFCALDFTFTWQAVIASRSHRTE